MALIGLGLLGLFVSKQLYGLWLLINCKIVVFVLLPLKSLCNAKELVIVSTMKYLFSQFIHYRMSMFSLGGCSIG